MIQAENILEIVANYYKIDSDELLTKKRVQPYAEARQLVVWLVRKYCYNMHPNTIAQLLHRDRCTILYAERAMDGYIATDKRIQMILRDIENELVCLFGDELEAVR